MFIGELATRTGATPKAIRLYESLGLLGPVRRQGSYRIYSDRDCQQVQIIRQAQGLGFKLSELLPVLRTAGGEPDWQGLAGQLELKQANLCQEVRRLNRLKKEVERVKAEIRHCLDGKPLPDAGQCSATAVSAPVGPDR